LINNSQYGHLETVKYLVSLGADIHANNDEAIQQASRYGHLKIVKYLIKQGANIHADSYAIKEALHNGYDEVVQYLIDYSLQ